MSAGLPPDSGAKVPVASGTRSPGWLRFFAVSAIALGAVRGLSAVSSLAAPAIYAFMKVPDTGAESPVAQAQAEMQGRIQAIYEHHKRVTQLSAGVGAFAAVGLIVGGIGCLSLRRRARLILMGGMAVGLMLELGLARYEVHTQTEIMNASTDLMRRMADLGGQGPANQVQHIAVWFATATRSLGIALAVGLVVARTVFLGAGLVYLLRPGVRRLFEPVS